MKRKICLSAWALLLASALPFTANANCYYNDADEIPEIVREENSSGWSKIEDVAQYKMADWSNVVGKAKGVSLWEAKQIADSDSRITYFFHVKGWQLVLENLEAQPSKWRVFNYGDAIFFSGEPWWGTAPDLADGYVRKSR